MKKVLKFLVPILLAIVIVLCLVWYLFVYDRAFTRDVLLSSARFFDSNNKPAVAAWFYDLAYNQSVDSDEVAIELAQQHKLDGNFTQAEVVLSKAIEENASAALYTALSRTYVEQDKILDAVKLLGGITNAQILAEMETLRPAAPTVSPDPGFYNQYIPVTVSAESGKLFVGIGEYPSIMDKPCTEPVILTDGENILYAVAVADNGLVSPLATFTYTVGGIIEEAVFADHAVENSVRQLLGVDEDVVLMSNQIWEIESFTMPVEAMSFADLKYMPFLKELTIVNGSSNQLSILSTLTNLTSLTIQNTPVSDSELSIIGSLTSLKKLTLSNCGLSTAEPIGKLNGLTYLDLGNNAIRNIQPLSGLTGLTELRLQHNVLTDLGSLTTMKNLTWLDISYNSLSTLTPICNLGSLVWLDANHNSLTEVTNVGALTALQELDLSYNSLQDVSSLSACTALTELNISNNTLTDITSTAALMNLTKLDLSYNQVTALPAFSVDCALVTIDGSHNSLTDLEALEGLHALNGVYMDYNEKVKSVECLATCPNLVIVNVYGTAVTEVKSLTDQSIIVNFNPTQSDSLL